MMTMFVHSCFMELLVLMSKILIYLKPGESFTIDTPTIPGRTITSVRHQSYSGSGYDTLGDEIPLPLTISYDDLLERDPFNNDEQAVSPNDRYTLIGEIDPLFDDDKFLTVDGYYLLDYDGSNFNVDFARGIYDSFSYGYAGMAQSVPFKMYVLEGEALPLPESLYGQTLTGIAFMRDEYEVTDIYTRNIVYSDIHERYDNIAMFMLYSEGSSNFDLSTNGQTWEALDFNKVPGVQEKLDEIEDTQITTEESEATQYIDVESTETKSTSVNGNAVAVGILITLSIIAFVVFYNKKKK